MFCCGHWNFKYAVSQSEVWRKIVEFGNTRKIRSPTARLRDLHKEWVPDLALADRVFTKGTINKGTFIFSCYSKQMRRPLVPTLSDLIKPYLNILYLASPMLMSPQPIHPFEKNIF